MDSGACSEFRIWLVAQEPCRYLFLHDLSIVTHRPIRLGFRSRADSPDKLGADEVQGRAVVSGESVRQATGKGAMKGWPALGFPVVVRTCATFEDA